ncbi:MAG: four helix bundle protein [Patescibacteria group bacterium]
MATVQTFEELVCWQKARKLTQSIYREFKDSKFKYLNVPIDYGLRDQIQRASVSIMSNIAEGFERGTKQEFLNYLYIAKGSSGEVRAQLYVALDAGYINIETFKYLNSLAIECSRLLSSFIAKVKVSEVKGLQYKKEYRKGMSSTNKMILESSPELKEFYNPEKDEIEFWRK